MDCDNTIITDFQNELGAEELQKKCSKVATDIEFKNLTLTKLVEDLRDFLVNVSPSKRQYGLMILSKVLQDLPRHFLSPGELDFISAFYADRLKDHSQVIPPTLDGILAIIRCDNVSLDASNKLFTGFECNVSCQQQQQPTRRVIYSIFEEFFNKHGQEMLSYMNHTLLTSITSSMDGERDPKNLYYLFGWLPNLLKQADLSTLGEEMFEILACYFPVDFKAPPQDPEAITREELADGLCQCLCASPSFGEYCIPLALEKLESSVQIAKLDSLNLLVHGCKTFKPSDLIIHSVQLWEALKHELINNKAVEIQERSWIALRSFLNKLMSTNEVHSSDFYSAATTSIKKYLIPSSPQFTVAWRMMSEFALASEDCCIKSTNEMVPLLLNIYNLSANCDEKVKVLPALLAFLLVFNKVRPENGVFNHPELEFIPKLFIKETRNESQDMRKMAYLGLSQIAHLMPKELRDALYVRLCSAIFENEPESIRDRILECLERFSIHYPEEVMSAIVQPVNVEEIPNFKPYFEALCVLISQPELSERIIDIFITFLTHDRVEIVSDAAHCLRIYLLKNENNNHVEQTLINKNAVHRIIVWVKEFCTILRSDNKNLLECISFILSYLIGIQSSNAQTKIYQREMEVIKDCHCNKYVFVVLLATIHYKLRPDVQFNHTYIEKLIQEEFYTENHSDQTSNAVTEVIVLLLANIVNKCEEGKLDQYLHALEERIESGKNITKVIALLPFITKALAQRNNSHIYTWLEKMLSLLPENEEVAKGFQIIMDDSYDVLNTKSHCTVGLLYRQRFFTLASQRLSELYDSNKNSSYLLAFGYLWCHSSHQVIILNFQKILRLTMMCLERCRDARVLCVILDTLKVFIGKQESEILEHLEDFIEHILKLVEFTDSMKVRVAALQCLQNFTVGYPVYKLLPYKQDVLDGLGKCIDDKKRIVRKEAVLARSQWYLIDTET